jgi:hypothetical protein
MARKIQPQQENQLTGANRSWLEQLQELQLSGFVWHSQAAQVRGRAVRRYLVIIFSVGGGVMYWETLEQLVASLRHKEWWTSLELQEWEYLSFYIAGLHQWP